MAIDLYHKFFLTPEADTLTSGGLIGRQLTLKAKMNALLIDC
jgi:hypothetical protein